MRSTTSLTRWVLALVNVVVLVAGVSVAGAQRVADPADRPVAATLALQGSARITGPDERTIVSGGDHELREGDVVDLLDGEGALRMVDGGSIELRSRRGPGGSRLALTEVPTLLAGDALVVAPAGRELAVDAGGARMRLNGGAGRISRSTATTFVVYEGVAAVSSGGRELPGGVPAMRQVVVPVLGKLPMSPSPLSFGTVADPWDRRFLGEVIDLEAALERRAIGFTTSLRDDFTPDVFFFHAVLPGLVHEPAFDQALLDEQQRPLGETLVGAAVALVGDGGEFDDRWREVFRLREEGAGWGVVAVDQRAPRAALMSALDEAVNRSPLFFGGPSPSPVFEPRLPPARPPGRPAAPPAAPAPSVPAVPPVRRSSPAAAPAPPPSPVLVPGPSEEPGSVLEPVVDPLVNLLDGALDRLEDLTGGLL